MASRGEEILLLAASGLTDKQIAEQLCISTRTVEGHWRRLRESSGTNNRAGLIARHYENSKIQLAEANLALKSQIETLESERIHLQQLSNQNSAILQTEINQLYQEVNRLKQNAKPTDELNSIVIKGNVLAFRILAEAPYNCLYMSDSVRLFGYRPTDFTTNQVPITQLFHPADFATAWSKALAQIESGTHRLERKYRILSKRGEERTILDRCIYEEATPGQPATLSVFAFDITHTNFLDALTDHPNLK
ncbi:hypothetical protein CCB80_01755 [Armatimonadetes bacterium Uphvl-Ar1]|nr:hypothetical protein CCB80_01755 [Armatimonadetes bacterium Uphvl-Ar1]